MKRREGLVVFITAAAVVAAVFGWLRYPIWRAQKMVADQMLDPGSATFREVRVVKGAVCGFVNAKNRYGAYVGYTMFAVEDTGAILIQPTTSPDTSISGTLGEKYARMKELEARLALLKRILGYCDAQQLPGSAK